MSARICRSWARSAFQQRESEALVYTARALDADLPERAHHGVVPSQGKQRAAARAEARALLSTITAAWFFITFIGMMLALALNFDSLFSHVPGSLKAALVLPIIFVLLTLALVVALMQAWRGGYWTAGRRVRFTFSFSPR